MRTLEKPKTLTRQERKEFFRLNSTFLIITLMLLAACKPKYESDKTSLEHILGVELPVSSYYFYSNCQFINGFLDVARGDTLDIFYEYFKFEATETQALDLITAFGLSEDNPYMPTNFDNLRRESSCEPKWWQVSEPFELFERPSYQYDEYGIPVEFNPEAMYLLYKEGEIYIYRVK